MASSSYGSTRSWVNKARSQRSTRAVLLFLIATTLISVCGFRLAYLQLIEGKRNRELADSNRTRPIPMVADRGNIVDRKGVPLAACLGQFIFIHENIQKSNGKRLLRI